MSEGGGGGDGGGGYPGGPAPSSTVPDQQDSKSGLPPFSSFGEMDPVTGRITNTDGEALQTSRLLDISSWDYYGEGLSGRLLDRGDGFPMLIPQPQYRPWESKDGHHEFPGSPLNKLPSFQSQFTAFPQDQNGETVLTTLTPAPPSPNSSSSGLPSFHTLSTVPPRGYPLVPAPVQAREIPSIQQQILDERHIHLFQGAPHQQYHQLGGYQPQPQQATLLTVVKTEPLIVTQLQSGYEHHDVGIKMEEANSPRGYLDSRKKERRKIRASSMESSNESDGVGSSSVESSGQVAAISSTAGFKSPLACHQPNMHSEDDLHDMSDKPVKKKRKRCGECIGCQRKDNCGDCAPCRNDKSHQICKMRRCEKLTEKKHLLYLNHDYPRGERGRGRGKGRGGASYRKLHQTPRSPLPSPNLQLNGGVDSNNMMTTIPDHNSVVRESKIEPQVTQTNLPPISGTTMPLYSGAVQPGMEAGGFTTPLREHRFGNSVWQTSAAAPDPNGAWAPQGQFIQQIAPPQIEEIRYPQYAVAGYPQASPVVGYQQNSFMQANGNLYNGTPQQQPSPHSMHNGNARSTPTLNGNMEYVEQTTRPTEYMNGSYPHTNQTDVMAPPTSSTPTSRCGSAQLENGEGKYTNPPTPTTPSNQGNAMPGYPLQIPPQSAQSSRNSSGYPGQLNESTDRGNKGESNKMKNSDKELWSSSPRPTDNMKEEIQLDNQMRETNENWGDSRNGSQGAMQAGWGARSVEVPTSQHQQDSWPPSPQQVNHSIQQQRQQMQEAEQRYQLQHQMNQNQMQHQQQQQQKSPQMNNEEQIHRQPSPQVHQPTQNQSQQLIMQHQQQHSPMMAQHQMNQQQMHQQQSQSQHMHQQQSQVQMHQQQTQTQQQIQMHQQQSHSQQMHQQQTQTQQQVQMHQQQSQTQQNQEQLHQLSQIQHQQQTQMRHHQQQMQSHLQAQQQQQQQQQQSHGQQGQLPHQNMQNHRNQIMQHPTNVHHRQQQQQPVLGAQGGSPHHGEMWTGQPNSRPPSQNPPEPWPNESVQQQMWTNEKKPNQFNERAELNNRLKTMILNKQQQEMKKIQDGGLLGYQDQKNLPPVSSGNFLALGHHPQKSVSEGGGFRSRGSYPPNGIHAMENIVNSVKYEPENNFPRRTPSAKSHQAGSQTEGSPALDNLSRANPPLSPGACRPIKQEPLWDERPGWSSFPAGDSPRKETPVKAEKEPGECSPAAPGSVKTEQLESDTSKEFSFDEGDTKTEDDVKLSPEHMERLKANLRDDVPGCSCFPSDHIPTEPGPFYTHLGSAKSLEELREDIEKRTSLSGTAIRVEKVLFTGKEGKTTSGCPLGKWILRRGGAEEKILMVVKNRKGHSCPAAWIVVAIVAWEGVPPPMADDMYDTISDKLKNYGVVTSRRCGVNEPRTCACQGLDNTTCGASFSFGCSWSMYYNGCKFARSKTARKFKLSVKTEEQCMEDQLQNLATYISPIYKTMAPNAYANMTAYEEEAGECRLGLEPGRPWSGVTACFDFCAHAHRDIHNMNNGCTTVVSLTKHRGLDKPKDEQLHVLPLYVMDESDEFGSKEGYEEKVKSGAIECLTKYPCEIRTRQSPLESCRKIAKKRKDEREHAKRELAYKMSLSVDYSSSTPPSPHQNNLHDGLNNHLQHNYPNFHNMSERGLKGKEMNAFNQTGDQSRTLGSTNSHHSPQRSSCCPSSPFRSPLSVVTYSPGQPAFTYPSPSTPDTPTKQDRSFSPSSVFRRPVGRPPSRSSNPATPQPQVDSTYLKPYHDKLDSPYSHGMDIERSIFQPFPQHHHPPGHLPPYSPTYCRDSSAISGLPVYVSPLREGFGSKDPQLNGRSFESYSAPVSPVNPVVSPLRLRATYSTGSLTPMGSPSLKCTSVSTQCSPSRTPLTGFHQAPSPARSPSSGYCSGGSLPDRDYLTPYEQPLHGYTPPKWTPYSQHSMNEQSHPVFTTPPTTPTSLTTPESLPAFQSLERKDQLPSPWRDYPYPTTPNMGVPEQSWNPTEPSPHNPYNQYPSPLYQQNVPSQKERLVHSERQYRSHLEHPADPPKHQWGTESRTSLWSGPDQATPTVPDVEPKNLLGTVTDFTNNEECFLDPNVGGVAIALSHGAVLFEVAKHELHATTALRQPNRFEPTRISLVFYQHRNLNKPDHGRGEWKEKQRCKKELSDKQTAAEMASVSTQCLDVQTESVGTEAMPYNYFQVPSPVQHFPPAAASSPHSNPSPSPSGPSPSAWGNLFPLHPSVVQGHYQESETLG